MATTRLRGGLAAHLGTRPCRPRVPDGRPEWLVTATRSREPSSPGAYVRHSYNASGPEKGLLWMDRFSGLLSGTTISQSQPPHGGLSGATRAGSREDRNPTMNHYQTKDGRFISLVFLNDSDVDWVDLCEHLDHRELATDSRFATASARSANCAEGVRTLDDIFGQRTLEEWKKILVTTRGVSAPMQSRREILEDPKLWPTGLCELSRTQRDRSVCRFPLCFSTRRPETRASSRVCRAHPRSAPRVWIQCRGHRPIRTCRRNSLTGDEYRRIRSTRRVRGAAAWCTPGRRSTATPRPSGPQAPVAAEGRISGPPLRSASKAWRTVT